MMDRTHNEPSGLGITLTFLAGILLIGTGLIIAAYGLSALIGDVGRSTNVFVRIGPDLWGAIHLFGGIGLVMAGGNIFVGKHWAKLVAIAAACVALIGGLMSIDAYPVWGIGLVALNLGIIWALTRHYGEVSLG